MKANWIAVEEVNRARYVTMAFELYATGGYSFPELRDALTDAGLRMPATRRYSQRPISIALRTPWSVS